MLDEDQPMGRWTGLFGRPTLFSEDARAAKEVQAKITAFGVGDLPDFQCVEIAFVGIDGWEPPVWGSDGTWIYLRRPQGVWKARLPGDIDGRMGVISEIKSGGSKSYGRAQIGKGFGNRPAWHVLDHEIDPSSLDWFYGPIEDGWEAGPLLSRIFKGDDGRPVADARSVFGGPAQVDECRFDGKHIYAVGSDGRKIKFTLEHGYLWPDLVRSGLKLGFGFGHGEASWMEPFAVPVSASRTGV